MKLEKYVIAALMFMASIPVFAQEENGFKKFSVEEAFEDNDRQSKLYSDMKTLLTIKYQSIKKK